MVLQSRRSKVEHAPPPSPPPPPPPPPQQQQQLATVMSTLPGVSALLTGARTQQSARSSPHAAPCSVLINLWPCACWCWRRRAALHTSMERAKLLRVVGRALDKSPAQRLPSEIAMLQQETSHSVLMTERGPHVHRDLCYGALLGRPSCAVCAWLTALATPPPLHSPAGPCAARAVATRMTLDAGESHRLEDQSCMLFQVCFCRTAQRQACPPAFHALACPPALRAVPMTGAVWAAGRQDAAPAAL